MGCLSSGLAKKCKDKPAGGLFGNVYVADASDVASLTVDADGIVTAITMETSGYFYPLGTRKNLGSFTETLTKNDVGAIVGEPTMTVNLGGRNQTTRNFIMELVNCCDLIVIHEEGSGEKYIWGFTGNELPGVGLGAQYAEVTESNATTGAAIADSNQEELTILWRTNQKARALDSALDVSLLLAP